MKFIKKIVITIVYVVAQRVVDAIKDRTGAAQTGEKHEA